MQIFFPNRTVTILLFFAVWGAVPLLFALICLRLPDSLFDPSRFLWRARKWEREGRFYETVFHVRSWKHLLPDGGGVWKNRGYKKRNLSDYSEENLRRYLIETARGELPTGSALSRSGVWLFAPPFVVWIMLAYALRSICLVSLRSDTTVRASLPDEPAVSRFGMRKTKS
jgi:glycosyl-4,4'-diaponeurosporenoate acyltransferase